HGGGVADHSPPDVSIRSRVHEYGGGAMCLVPGHAPGAFAYVDQADQRVWFCDGRGTGPDAATPRPLTPAPESADGSVHHGGLVATADGDWVLAVREAAAPGDAAPTRSVLALRTRTSDPDGEPPRPQTLFAGHDFFGAPCVDAAGERLAVVAWEHPDMPWDASRLFVVPLGRDADGSLGPAGTPWCVAGGPGESVGQPAWSADGSLRFVSDRSGWWRVYRHPGRPRSGDGDAVALSDDGAEYHGPDWVLAQHTMTELGDGRLVARRASSGLDALVVLDAPPQADARPTVADQPCVSIGAVCGHGRGVGLIGSTPDSASAVWFWDPDAGAIPVRPAARTALGPARVARPEPFTLTGRSGRPVYGTLYRPVRGVPGVPGVPGTPSRDDPPPLLVWCHGGPTSACQAGLDLTVQFFTTRGFAVACVDYAGSSGYGRAYRCALWGEWGVADAEDCLDAALDLARRGEVDRQRMAIRGGSAGGMTALNALASGEGFAACASWYGVTDLMGLVATTHDFESRYTDRLIGPLPGSEALYEERSPLARAAAMTGAVLLLQGTEDPIVPPAQATKMQEALAAAGRRCDLRFFEGEAHGFRRADTLTACLEAELGFYLAELHL
ncbi:MAG TPA: prolyl oligopeptidase family serine peptidase, partial [Acidimicrobiales bacterium]|nr:prolyl oligopeptidase family serine peptidase [Acidimicrobiales bacterium]